MEPATLEGSKTQRVYLLLRDEIVNGAHAPGDVLPGELRLAEQFGVSRVTIRRALGALEEGGLVQRRPGSGTVVGNGAARRATVTANFATVMPHLVEMGRNTAARLLSFAYVEPPAVVREALHLEPEIRTQRAVRVRSVEGRPFSHLITHVPEGIAQGYSETDLATTALFALLERSGVRVDHATQSISAVLATPEVAEALEVSVGAALVALTRVVFDAEGRGVEHLSALYRPDRIRLEMTLNRVGQAGARHWQPVVVAADGGDEGTP